jgi:hypothetical protein
VIYYARYIGRGAHEGDPPREAATPDELERMFAEDGLGSVTLYEADEPGGRALGVSVGGAPEIAALWRVKLTERACAVCKHPPESCKCPACPACGQAGRKACYAEHALRVGLREYTLGYDKVILVWASRGTPGGNASAARLPGYPQHYLPDLPGVLSDAGWAWDGRDWGGGPAAPEAPDGTPLAHLNAYPNPEIWDAIAHSVETGDPPKE